MMAQHITMPNSKAHRKILQTVRTGLYCNQPASQGVIQDRDNKSFHTLHLKKASPKLY